MSAEVHRAQLGSMTQIDSGAAGVVYRLLQYRLRGVGDLAFKEYFTRPTADEVRNLRALVAFRASLSPADRALLDELTAFPLRVVVDRGTVCGLVMRLIPQSFFSDQRLPSGKTAHLPTKAQWLVVDHTKAVGNGITVPKNGDLPDRLVLCAKLAHVLGLLHRHGFTYGDLSLNNVVFSAEMPPRVMLVDCDSIKSPGVELLQRHTPDWAPPEVAAGLQQTQDPITDAYKLALFILRCLTPGEWASIATDPNRVLTVFDGDGFSLMRSALGAVRALRPTASQWYRYLVRFLADLTSPPRFAEVAVDERVVVVGDLVSVRWRTRGVADTVTVITSDGHRQAVDGKPGSGLVRVSVLRTGPIRILAENSHGVDESFTPSIHVIDWPRVGQVHLPNVLTPPTVLAGDSGPAGSVRAAMNDLVMRPVSLPPLPFEEFFRGALIDLSPAVRDISALARMTTDRRLHDLTAQAAADAFTVLANARDALIERLDGTVRTP